jgi:alpha-D-ribose 1-methylphosphonate 5-triphosphate synthase subunit PhnL
VLETGEIAWMLCIVGFVSPSDWLKSYDGLSQGEKMRVDIARALCSAYAHMALPAPSILVYQNSVFVLFVVVVGLCATSFFV